MSENSKNREREGGAEVDSFWVRVQQLMLRLLLIFKQAHCRCQRAPRWLEVMAGPCRDPHSAAVGSRGRNEAGKLAEPRAVKLSVEFGSRLVMAPARCNWRRQNFGFSRIASIGQSVSRRQTVATSG